MSEKQDPNSKKQQLEIRYVPIEYLGGDGKDDEEIDFIGLFKNIWEGKYKVAKFIAAFFVLGLFIALTSKNEFTSEVTILPETSGQVSIGQLGSLARQFGIGSGIQPDSEGIPPELYPQIAKNLGTMRELMNYTIIIPGTDEQATIYEYFDQHYQRSILSYVVEYTILLPFTIRRALRSTDEETTQAIRYTDSERGERIITMTRSEWDILEQLQDRISVNYSTDNGLVKVRAKMPDRNLAAEIADQVVIYLSDFITNYRTEKARDNLIFIEKRFEEAEIRFDEAQKALARFNDENRGQLTAMARTEEQLLQSRYNLAFNLYNIMAERLEEARIKVQEETPVVKVIEQAAVPDRSSEPRRALIVAGLTFMGGIVGVIWVFGIYYWNYIKKMHI